MNPETKMQHHTRRAGELQPASKAALCAMYRSLGGLGGIHPPEKWRKDEVITSITEMEWDRLPADAKLPDPVRMGHPCDTCGKGEGARAHAHGGDHNYVVTWNPDAVWVPHYDTDTEISADVAAHVLHNAGAGGYPADDFMRAILAAWPLADDERRARLAVAFPDYAAAITLLYRDDVNGRAELRRIATTLPGVDRDKSPLTAADEAEIAAAANRSAHGS